MSLSERHSPGSIQSAEAADQALAQAAKERSDIKARFEAEQRACYSLFFTNACIDAARERRRLALSRVRTVEIEANAFNRQARILQRNDGLAEKSAPKGEAKLESPFPAKIGDSADAEKDMDVQARSLADTGQGAASEPQPARSEPKRQRAEAADDPAQARKRADNIAAYERKVKKAEERQRKLEARRAEKERKQAGKEAAAPPPPQE